MGKRVFKKDLPKQPHFLDHAAMLFNSVVRAQVSSSIALAVIIFAAGSTISMASLASAEISAGADAPVGHHLSFNQAFVLGDSTTTPQVSVIDDSALEATGTIASVKLSARQKSFDSTLGRWDYVINYSSQNLNGTGSITIGSYPLASGLTAATGTVETGAILKPSTVYHVTFWVTDSSGGKLAAAQIEIKTGKGKASGQGPMLILPCQAPGQASSTFQGLPVPGAQSSGSSTPGSMFCLKTPDGKMLCPRPPVCGPITLGHMGDDGQNASGTPPNWPPKPPTGTRPTNTTDHMPSFSQGQGQQGNSGNH